VVPGSAFAATLQSYRGTWRLAKFVADVLPASTATLLELDDVHGYDALNVDHYLEVLGLADSTMLSVSNAALRRRIGPISDAAALESRILDLLNVTRILALRRVPEGRPQPAVLPNPDALPRAFLVGGARYFETYREILAYMGTQEFEPAEIVLLRGSKPQTEGLPGCPGTAVIVEHEAHRVVIEVNAEREAYLVLSDTYYPGWRAEIGGTGAEILRADYAFRAVRVGPGTHTVVMTYVPDTLRLGVLLTIGGLALAVALMVSRREWL
jgi:hypothetical protein